MLSGKVSLRSSRSGAKSLTAIFIVAVLLASAIGAFLFIAGDTSASGGVVKYGSKVKVDYIGYIGTPEDGHVFDTSLQSVAQDNSTYPKTPLFTYRSTAYGPLSATIGAGNLISGFEHGLLGMKVGETKTLTVLPSQGYGDTNRSKIVNLTLTETIDIVQNMTASEFKKAYGYAVSSQQVYDDPKYGWKIRVLGVDTFNDEITVRNEPADGKTYKAYADPDDKAYGWDITVNIDEDAATITVSHQLRQADGGEAKGYDSTDRSDASSAFRFVVKSVDEAAGTAVIDKNSEVVGVTLTFVVKIVSIS